MCIELKIKAKHLAEEARIIKFEEEKLKKQIRFLVKRDGVELRKTDPNVRFWWQQEFTELGKVDDKLNSLVVHRKWDLRNEVRATHLARTFLAGKSAKSVENKTTDLGILMYYVMPRVVKLVNKYGKLKLEKKDLSNWYIHGTTCSREQVLRQVS